MVSKKYSIHFLCLFFISANLYCRPSFLERPEEGWVQYAKDVFWGTEKPLPPEVLRFIKYNKSSAVPELLNGIISFTPADTIIKKNEHKELELDAVLAKVDRTKTEYGKWGLKKSLIPHANKRTLLESQRRIKALLGNVPLREQLNQCIDHISKVDDALLAYFNAHNALHKQAESLYFSILDKSLNESEKALGATYLFDVSKTVLALTAGFGVMGIVQTISQEKGPHNKELQNKTLLALLVESIKEGLKLPFKYHKTSLELLNDPVRKEKIYNKNLMEGLFKVASGGSLGDQCQYMVDKMSWSPTPSLLLFSSYLVLYDIGLGVNIRSSARHLASLHETTQGLRTQIEDVAQLFKRAKELGTLLQTDPTLSQWSPVVSLGSFLSGFTTSLELKKLLTLLDDPIFLPENNSWIARGKLLLAHRFLIETRQEMVPFLQAIGHIDALLSIAALYEEHKNKDNTFCFVEYIDAQNACCEFKDFWHPRVENTVVTNSMTIGFDEQPNKVIFTGPNGGGKSTAMDAITLGFIFGQSWGIVPASTARMCVLSGIRTALNPQANISKGLSSFMAEKLRMDQITQFITHYKNEPILVVLDEPYKGTVESESAYRICEFAESIASNNYCMLIMATHLEKPIYLQEKTGKLINCQLEFAQPEPNIFRPTYKVLPGPALWWFHNEEQRHAYIDSLLFDQSLFA